MTDVLVQGRVCASTGLRLVPPPTSPVHRIRQTRFGPLDPPLRDGSADRTGWGRWDTEFGRTLYLADTARSAYAEVLAHFKSSLPAVSMGELFPDDGPSDDTLAAAVMRELPHVHDAVTKGWRDSRARQQYQVSAGGWIVDVLAAESIAAINTRFGGPGRHSADRLTISQLTGEDRSFTTAVAGWIRTLYLEDGSPPLGIRYLSKHGSNLTAYAIWLRAIDDGRPEASEVIQPLASAPITADDADLIAAAALNGMRVL